MYSLLRTCDGDALAPIIFMTLDEAKQEMRKQAVQIVKANLQNEWVWELFPETDDEIYDLALKAGKIVEKSDTDLILFDFERLTIMQAENKGYKERIDEYLDSLKYDVFAAQSTWSGKMFSYEYCEEYMATLLGILEVFGENYPIKDARGSVRTLVNRMEALQKGDDPEKYEKLSSLDEDYMKIFEKVLEDVEALIKEDKTCSVTKNNDLLGEVTTKAGILRAYKGTDPDAPAIIIMLEPKGYDQEIDVCMAEVVESEDYQTTYSGSSEDVTIHVWGDATTEDYTTVEVIRREEVVAGLGTGSKN